MSRLNEQKRIFNKIQVILILGSNISPEKNIRKAIDALGKNFEIIKISGFYETPPFGMHGDMFINAAILIATDLSIEELKWKYLRPIEANLGRKRIRNKYSPRTIDIDIVAYQGNIIDEDIFLHPHLAVPIADISPTIIEERQLNIATMDVFSRLMMDRIIFLGTPIDDYVANIIQAQLLFLESTDPAKDIQIYFNTPGGTVHAGLGIYDTMQYISSDVATICTGMAASMGAVLLCAGTKGKRSGLKHSRIMIHQPVGGAQGQASDIEITAREILKLRKELYNIISEHSGNPYKKVEKDSDRDYWMTAEEAKDYGMIDEILFRNMGKR